MLRISVCAEAVSSLTRSSKVNISALMRSAASRFSSSSAVRKRVSVWRSKLLKISAITSWASRRRVCDRLDMNSVRSVCSTRSITSFCTDSIRSMRLITSSERSSGRIAKHAGGVLGPQLGQHHRHGLRVFVLEIVRQHLFLHVGELFPHVAAGGAADLVHDAADALLRQVLLQQALGGVVVAEQGARGRHARDEFQQQLLDRIGVDRAERRHHDGDFAQLVVVEQAEDLAAVLLAERQHQHGRPLRAGQLAAAGIDLRLAGKLGHQAADVLADRLLVVSSLV